MNARFMWRRLSAHPVHLRAAAGQERLEVPGAVHTACTIEMANLGARVDVAVIDEIQVQREISRTFLSTPILDA